MSNDSHRVPLSKVVAFLRDIGLDPVDPADLRSVTFGAGGVEVVRYRRNEQGQIYAVAPNTVATETVTLALDADA
ncbi:hypothetical protein GA0070622_1188 [Micromonospora sediminicola]|uniref:Uncharacterized protein n=1 Tax=Micromonospora sediminicola TaxID=946078 RepID=A0A1A9B541_9ACTN|nr:hypothetical protein [Micromonospora sediminicola]SBT64218.1 hypothetical protein GA0070622_1188 [Micromonospora sediminicola]